MIKTCSLTILQLKVLSASFLEILKVPPSGRVTNRIMIDDVKNGSPLLLCEVQVFKEKVHGEMQHWTKRQSPFTIRTYRKG